MVLFKLHPSALITHLLTSRYFPISLYVSLLSCKFITVLFVFQADFVNSMIAAQEFSLKVSLSLKVKKLTELFLVSS